jgi:lipopolysaccharide heptosyltransferase I
VAVPAHPGFSPASILIIRLSALGDVIRTLPLLPPLRARFPEARLGWLCEPAQKPVVEVQPLVDEVLEFPRRELTSSLRSGHLLRAGSRLGTTLATIRRWRPEVVLDAQGTYKSALLMRLSGAPLRIGFARGAAREYIPGAATRHVNPVPARQSRVEKALSLLAPLAADPSLAAAGLPRDPAAAGRAESIWAGHPGRPRILISPGASNRQGYKRWPPRSFAATAAGLAANGATFQIAWGPGEEELAREVVTHAGDAAHLLPATSLAVLAELLRSADLFIGNDSGPMHLAWLVGTPVVALYGATDPVVNAPWGQGGHRQVAVTTAQRLARGRDPSLMSEIEPAAVIAAAQETLAGVKPSSN